jgi:hypothetical protein
MICSKTSMIARMSMIKTTSIIKKPDRIREIYHRARNQTLTVLSVEKISEL